MKRWSIHCGDVMKWIHTLPDNSIHACITSPPYFGLRDYGTGTWSGGDENCDHKAPPTGGTKASGLRAKRDKKTGHLAQDRKSQPNSVQYQNLCRKCGAVRVDDQIGLERTPDEYVAKLVELFRGVRRALHPTGVVFLNLGDSYSGGGNGVGSGKQLTNVGSHIPGRKTPPGYKPKDLIGIPWMVAFAMRADGWYLRAEIIWHKPNSMPFSVTDRPTPNHEQVFLLTKNPRYFYDYYAIREASKCPEGPGNQKTHKFATAEADAALGGRHRGIVAVGPQEYANKRSVWTVNVAKFKGSHFATFPRKLITPMIKAGTSEKGCCPRCLAPWVRVLKKVRTATRPGADTKVTGDSLVDGNRDPGRHVTEVRHAGWKRGCSCKPATPIPCTVLDPFTGSGTTLIVANDLKRTGIGCELNKKYVRMAEKRLAGRPVKLF